MRPGKSPLKSLLTFYLIIIQIFTPLSLAFSSLAHASGQPKQTAKQRYIVQPGETAWQIAARYDISPGELRKLNPGVTAQGMHHLQEGETLYVPHSGNITLPNLGLAENKSTVDPRAAQDNNLAQNLMQASGLANAQSSKARNNMVVGMAANAASAHTEQVLGTFGTARVQLSLDSQLRMANSSVDMLLPLYENQKSMLFTQLGWRNKDDRNTVNLGGGVRVFSADWMYGSNVFWDNDLSGKNRRLGIGAEAWTHYLKLSGNYYFGLTDWHQSRDFVDYDERPANGWDIRSEGWLPAYPQLGGKLMYEQYRGKEVALFGKDKRQKNPHAVTAGVNWTPFPLLTLGTEHRQGSNSSKNSQISMTLNVTPGMSWKKHVDSDGVALLRSLAFSKYDLVERNNNIVLEYRKQDLIYITLPSEVEGYVLSTQDIFANIKTKYALSHVEWLAPDFVGDGGILKNTDNKLTITFPPHATDKIYTLSAVAWDKKGNRSNRAVTYLSVIHYPVNETYSTKTALPQSVSADGQATSTIHLSLRDNDDKPITVAADSLKSHISQSSQPQLLKSSAQDPQLSNLVKDPTISSFKQVAPGDYEAIYTAGTAIGDVTITTLLNDIELKTITIKQTHVANELDVVSPDQYSLTDLTLSKEIALANGKDTVHAYARVVDPSGKPVEGARIIWEITAPGVITTSSLSDKNGIAESQISSVKVGDATVSAKLNQTIHQADLSFVQDPSAAGIADTLSVLLDDAFADGNDTNVVQIKVTDAFNNPLSGKTVNLSADNGAVFIGDITSITTDDSGQATVELTSHRVGVSTVTVALNGTSKSATVNFVVNRGSAGIASGDLIVTKDNAKADGTDSNTVYIRVTDAHANPVPHQMMLLATDDGEITTNTVSTGEDGTVTIPIRSVVAGSTVVTASINRKLSSVDMTFVADSDSAQVALLRVQANGALADGLHSNVLQVTVNDINGNPLSGQTVSLSADNGATFIGNISSVKTNTSGRATVGLTSTQVGESTVTATLNNTSKKATVNFVVNSAGAEIAQGDLTVTKDNAKADGTDSNTVHIRVTDGHDNPVPNQTVVMTADNSAAVTSVVTTGADGTVSVPVTSRVSGSSEVAASVNGQSSTVNVNFVADSDSAQVVMLRAQTHGAIANGLDSNVALLRVVDANNNPVSGQVVSLSADNGAVFLGNISSATTDTDGRARVELMSTQPGISTVSATLNGKSMNVRIEFVANQVSSLEITFDNAKAKIGETITATVIAKDAQGNNMPDAEITFHASDVKNRQDQIVSSGALLLNGETINANKIYTTDSFGKVSLSVTDPNGTGVSRSLNAVSGESSVKAELIFTVVTSPDTPLANMWGHMADTANSGGMVYTRPKLGNEFPGHGYNLESGEYWARPYQGVGITLCAASGKSLASRENLLAFYQTYPSGQVKAVLGWPVNSSYHTTTLTSTAGSSYTVFLTNGSISSGSVNLRRLTICL